MRKVSGIYCPVCNHAFRYQGAWRVSWFAMSLVIVFYFAGLVAVVLSIVALLLFECLMVIYPKSKKEYRAWFERIMMGTVIMNSGRYHLRNCGGPALRHEDGKPMSDDEADRFYALLKIIEKEE